MALKRRKDDKKQNGYLKECKAEIRERKSVLLLAYYSWSFRNGNGTEVALLLNTCGY